MSPAPTRPTRGPGRPAAATREDVIALARERFLAGKRVDMQGIARELGLARATMHRWYGTREELLGEMLAELAEARIAVIRRESTATGAIGLLDCFDRFNRDAAATKGLSVWLAQEHQMALRILTASGGIVQTRTVAAVEGMIDAEIAAGAFVAPMAPATLAHAIVRLGGSFLYSDAVSGVRGDTERLRELEAALLGINQR
jgi:AcrR family transcriptional regulator